MARKKSEDEHWEHLLAVAPDGRYRSVPCTYEGIKEGLNDATFDFVHNDIIGMYVDDEGMLNGLEFNAPASIFMARALWGPVVLCAAFPDGEGDTLPAAQEHVKGLRAIARIWQEVLADSLRLGQVIMTTANDSTIPPARIYNMSDEDMERFLMTGQIPDREPDA